MQVTFKMFLPVQLENLSALATWHNGKIMLVLTSYLRNFVVQVAGTLNRVSSNSAVIVVIVYLCHIIHTKCTHV